MRILKLPERQYGRNELVILKVIARLQQGEDSSRVMNKDKPEKMKAGLQDTYNGHSKKGDKFEKYYEGRTLPLPTNWSRR